MKLMIASQTGTNVRSGARLLTNTIAYKRFTTGFMMNDSASPMAKMSPATPSTPIKNSVFINDVAPPELLKGR